MNLEEAVKILNNSPKYNEWHNTHKSSFMTYGFIMIDPHVKQEWQLGFYNPEHDTISTFTIGKKISLNPEAEIFKNNKVNALKLEKIKTKLDKVLEKAEQLQKTKYSVHKPIKKIVIVQNLDIGQVWNITFITATYKTLNIKIDTANGNVVKHDLIEIFRFQ